MGVGNYCKRPLGFLEQFSCSFFLLQRPPDWGSRIKWFVNAFPIAHWAKRSQFLPSAKRL